MLSRFLFNLRQVGQPISIYSDNIHASQLSMPAFARPPNKIVGNIGEDLQDITFGADDYESSEVESPSDFSANDGSMPLADHVDLGTKADGSTRRPYGVTESVRMDEVRYSCADIACRLELRKYRCSMGLRWPSEVKVRF